MDEATRKLVDAAWAAGLFEGEGYFSGGTLTSGRVRFNMGIAMTDLDVLEKFQRIVGCGSIRPEPERENRKQQWRWTVTSRKDIYRVCGMILVHLGDRRKQRLIEMYSAMAAHDSIPYGKKTKAAE